MNRYTIHCLCIFNCLIILSLNAQNDYSISWKKTFGGTNHDEARAIRQTNDGGFIIANYSLSSDGDVSGNYGSYDYWVFKLNSQGQIEWEQNFGGSGSDLVKDIYQTTDGGYFLVGKGGSDDGDVSGSHGSSEYWVLKLTEQGNISWQKSYGGSGGDYCRSVKQTSDRGYIICGDSGSDDGDVSGNHGSDDIWLVKTDASGNIEWQYCYGGSDPENGWVVIQTSDGGFVAGGETLSSDGMVENNHGNADAWIFKVDANGNLLWQRCLGGSAMDGLNKVIETRDGSLLLACYTESSNGDVSHNHGGEDYWIVKMDQLGNILWEKTYGGSLYEDPWSITELYNGNFMINGRTSSNDGDISDHHGGSDFWLIEIDAAGNLVWESTFGGSQDDKGMTVIQNTDQSIMISGETWSNDVDVSGNKGLADSWVVKLTRTGQEQEPTQTAVPLLNTTYSIFLILLILLMGIIMLKSHPQGGMKV